ncbi:MAG: hypothetical protein WC852_01830 [Candidatus Nanoarchaeia archaeon]|jgi:ppGpp synthetase/RelA/SpoT-type nucleotidyltranferase
MDDINESIKWYASERPIYQAFANKVANLLKEILDVQGITFHAVTDRAKTVESFKNKIQTISVKPKDIQDLAGVRVIAHLKSDVDAIVKVITAHFKVNPLLSKNKAHLLGTDKMGYQSVHLVVQLSDARASLIEYKRFQGLVCEIQVRTVLQHAWAEIEHDRRYKFTGILPDDISRKFSLLAGTLELVDNGFESISKEIDNYSADISKKTQEGNLNIPLNSTSLKQYFKDKFQGNNSIKFIFGPKDDRADEVIAELKVMGLNTLAELDIIFKPDIKEALLKFKEDTNLLGIIRDILMIYDIENYFENAWDNNWGAISQGSIDFLKIFNIDVIPYIEKYGLSIN